ncbi:cystathionine beta-lyase [Altererythrobacter aurantiacus]|uniref:Cystathionine beta-lyase n=1 Tax=Parapontixanthobacter aurantiacus TaxID=1463599 RepID=A0A844ZB35_9SPHN|nr:cystathionine beta-lyase [Parapontixanthobacter aurantiacus]MXO84724.1 cystathionine beta-lyase [Parapontixanthobacter aurantiacus]
MTGSKTSGEHDQATRAVSAGRVGDWAEHIVNPPIYRGSTHLHANCAALKEAGKSNHDGHFFYGRRGSPTQWALADALTQLEPDAFGTMLYPSGVAALSGALLSSLSSGDVLLMTDNVYDPSRGMANGLFKKMGIETRYFDPLDLDDYSAKFCDRTRAVLLEAPGSLTMEMPDIPRQAAIARERGATSLIDNTWATSLGFPALRHGCDIAIMSLTKHVGGHSDLLMGSASAGERHYRRLRRTAQQLGAYVSPDEASLCLRGLRTMPLRLQRSMDTARQIARWLRDRKEVAHVLCPFLEGDPGYSIWQRDFTGGCGLFSFVLAGRSGAQRAALIDTLDLFGIGYSWGGYESLALPFDPASMRSVMRWPKPGWKEDDRLGVRLSIGLEDATDLIADLERGFAAMDKI